MLHINTNFIPYRLAIKNKQPVKMKIKVANAGNETALVSYDVRLPVTLSLERNGFRALHTNRAGNLEPGSEVTEYLEIFPRPITAEGEHTIIIKAFEHYNTYEFVKRQYSRQLGLMVDE